MSVGAMDVLDQYEQTMAAAVEPHGDPLFGGALGTTSTRTVRRPLADAPWAPTISGRASLAPATPRPSGPQRRAVIAPASLPHLDEAPRADALPLPPELAARFRTLCALRATDPARVIEGLVRSYVILGLAQGGGR